MILSEEYKNRLSELAGVKKNKMSLKQALEKMLDIANNNLVRAEEKNKQWDINHYKNDVNIIKKQLAEL